MQPPDGLLEVRGEVIGQYCPEERQGLQNQYHVCQCLMFVHEAQKATYKSQLVEN